MIDFEDNPDSEEESEDEEDMSGSVQDVAPDEEKEMDPLKIIMQALGNKSIIIRVFSEEFIT